MADNYKAQKLANARKKFLELKKEKQKHNEQYIIEPTEVGQSPPMESNTNIGKIQDLTATTIEPLQENVTQLSTYFNSSPIDNVEPTKPTITAFFDNLSLEQEDGKEKTKPEEDTVTWEDPEIRPYEIQCIAQKTAQRPEPSTSILCCSNCEQYKTELDSCRKQMATVNEQQKELEKQVHTIGVLVAEKTELNATIGELKSALQIRANDSDELQNRLKASRFRVSDLERELAAIKQELSINNHSTDPAHVPATTEHLQILRKERDGFEQDALEANEKVHTLLEQNSVLSNNLQTVKNELSLAQLRVQQLSMAGSGDYLERELASVQQDKDAIDQQLKDAQSALEIIQRERSDTTANYQEFIQQLNTQNETLGRQLDAVRQENTNYQLQEQQRICHIEELERQLQQYKIQQATDTTVQQLREELDCALGLAEQLQIEKQQLLERTEKLQQFERDFNEKTRCMGELETTIEQLQMSYADNTKLLATMESDKVAASRAIQQNVEIKLQLESMQDFVDKVNADKVQLMERISVDSSAVKELRDKLERAQNQMQILMEAIDIKDRELAHYIQTIPCEHQAVDSNDPSIDGCLDKAAAMECLETKLIKTMDGIAALTEEKQRLEHLVIQLQHETETIGEHVALYRQQRGLLKQKAYEKECQLSQLTDDRDVIWAKLEQIQLLANQLIKQPESKEFSPSLIGHRIGHILAQVKDSNLIRPTENFHHCPWCSGQLITV